MHISNRKRTRNIPESFSNLGLFKSLSFHNQRSLFLFSLTSKSFSSEWTPSWFQQEYFWDEEQSKKTIFFLSSLFSQKLFLFSLLFFSFQCHQMTIFQRLVIWRKKALMGLLGSYKRLVGIRSFSELEDGPYGSI